jgi:hypothetical protein
MSDTRRDLEENAAIVYILAWGAVELLRSPRKLLSLLSGGPGWDSERKP